MTQETSGGAGAGPGVSMKLFFSTLGARLGWVAFVLVFVSVGYTMSSWFKAGFTDYEYSDAVSEMRSIQRGLEEFRSKFGRYPPEHTWLDELMPAGREVINTNHLLFIELNGEKDVFGKPWVYRHPGLHHPEFFDLYSTGADGISESGGNDPDDIASWHHPFRWWYHYDDDFRISVRAGLAGLVAGLVFAVRWRLRMRQYPTV